MHSLWQPDNKEKCHGKWAPVIQMPCLWKTIFKRQTRIDAPELWCEYSVLKQTYD